MCSMMVYRAPPVGGSTDWRKQQARRARCRGCSAPAVTVSNIWAAVEEELQQEQRGERALLPLCLTLMQ